MTLSTLRFAVLFAVACLGACASAIPEPTPAHVERARASNPDVSLADLQQGRELFIGRCAGCHALPLPSDHSPKEWATVLERMTPLAQLDEDESARVESYLAATSQR